MRIAAFGIAALAVADPALTSSRSSRPIVAIVAPDSAADALLANRIARMLDRRFTVVRGEFAAAAATVVVGHAMPGDIGAIAGPLLTVEPSAASPSIRLMSVETPAQTLLDARSPVRVTAWVHGARGRQLNAQLRVAGAIVDQAQYPVLIDSGRFEFTLQHVPASIRVHLVDVRIAIEGAAASDSAFTVIDTRNDRLPVLFYDARPSWTSTFVRRAVQEDARFSVTQRTVTSRSVSNTAGAAPPSLRDPESLASFATIVVGAPDNLTATDVDALETFMRRRGGRVVLLMDGRAAGQVDRLAGVSTWRTTRSNAPSTIGNGALRGREFRWPASVPAGATVHAAIVSRDSARRAIVWSVPVGAGRLLLSGALDAWQHRGDSSGFNAFWTGILAELSSSAPPAVSVELSRRVLQPGEATQGRITVRDLLLSDRATRTATVEAALVSDSDSTTVRLWPDPTPGVFSGTIVAPRRPGVYRLVAWSGEGRGGSSISVAPETRAARHDDREVIEAFASSRGGSVVAEDELDQLPDRVTSAIQVVARVETWHPMRSPWWILPFALLLGVEWWARRRRGLS